MSASISPTFQPICIASATARFTAGTSGMHQGRSAVWGGRGRLLLGEVLGGTCYCGLAHSTLARRYSYNVLDIGQAKPLRLCSKGPQHLHGGLVLLLAGVRRVFRTSQRVAPSYDMYTYRRGCQ
jgi:hypothetical protein